MVNLLGYILYSNSFAGTFINKALQHYGVAKLKVFCSVNRTERCCQASLLITHQDQTNDFNDKINQNNTLLCILAFQKEYWEIKTI